MPIDLGKRSPYSIEIRYSLFTFVLLIRLILWLARGIWYGLSLTARGVVDGHKMAVEVGLDLIERRMGIHAD